MINFWASTFMLPKGCLKRIEVMCSRFLWSGKIVETVGSKVCWEDVCLPKKEGGLEIRRFKEWNVTLSLKLLWTLITGKTSLWANWHRFHHINQKSIWEVEIKSSFTWTFRTLLQLRPLAARFVRCNIGDGQSGSYWHDHWTPMGPLINILGYNGPRLLGIHSQAKIAEGCFQGRWIQPQSRHPNASLMRSFFQDQPPSLDPDQRDSFTWKINDKYSASFNAKETWEAIRRKRTEKHWTKLVWFKGATPRHAVHMWLTHMNRLHTRDRLVLWGVTTSSVCCTCQGHTETRDHLIFQCPMAVFVWKESFTRLRLYHQRLNGWNEMLVWIRQGKRSKTAPTLLRNLISQTIVYHLWRHRNNHLHGNKIMTPTSLWMMIERDVKTSITARRGRKNWTELMLLWIR